MIYTSSHNLCKTDKYRLVSISGNSGKDYIDDLGNIYNGECYPKLAPKLSFWSEWHEMKDKVPFEESTIFYIENYYNLVLSKLDPNEVYEDLNNSILLCYEDSSDFCHRHIVAVWLELMIDIKVDECHIIDSNLEIVKRPDYIKEYLIKYLNSIEKQKTLKINIK